VRKEFLLAYPAFIPQRALRASETPHGLYNQSMPAGWVHATFDLVVWGRSYFDDHRRKDRWAKTLGRWHRRRDHHWYLQFGKTWTIEDPFPVRVYHDLRSLSPFEAEKMQVDLSHDYLDKIWDLLDEQERCYWEGFFAWLLINPHQLIRWAGVDVLNGRIARTISNQTRWSSCPALRDEYARLRRYVEAVLRKNPRIRAAICPK
jgi:hypothetical protein